MNPPRERAAPIRRGAKNPQPVVNNRVVDESPPGPSIAASRTPPRSSNVTRLLEQAQFSQTATPVSQLSSANIEGRVTTGSRSNVLRDAVLDELRGHTEEYPKDWAAQQYHTQVPQGKDVKSFLEKSPLFDNATRRWTQLDDPKITTEAQTYVPIQRIIASVMTDLGELPTVGTVRRQVRNASKLPFYHVEDFDGCNHFTEPDLPILAAGQSFEVPLNHGCDDISMAISYTNIASFVEVKLNESSANVDAQMGQAGVYARYVIHLLGYSRRVPVLTVIRQILIQQATRIFVRCIVLNRVTFRLFHFDRAGAQYTPPINIHSDAETFVRLLLGISSLDEAVLGFHPAFKWTISPTTGRKLEGTVTVKDAITGVETCYEITQPQPETRCYTIRGLGIVYWRAKFPGPNGRQVLVKIAWRSEGRVPEHVHLTKAIGIPGIGQLISYHNNEISIADLRNRDWVAPSKGCSFHNAFGTCIVLEACGRPLIYFKSELQFLSALRDSLAGASCLFMVLQLGNF